MSVAPTLHLFGAGWLLSQAARIAGSEGWRTCVRTSSRLVSFFEENHSELQHLADSVFVSDSLSGAMRLGLSPKRGDVAFSFGAPWIFPSTWLEEWEGRVFNVHSRRLPEHRGAGDHSWLIMMGERQGRACIHRLTAGIDDGPVVAQRDFTYNSPYTIASYQEQTLRQSAMLLDQDLMKVLEGPGVGRPQDASFASYWPRLRADVHGWVDWSWFAAEIDSFIRAFGPPLAGCSTYLRGERVKIVGTHLSEVRNFHPFQAGLIFRVTSGGVHVAARGGSLVVEIEGRSTNDVRVGDRFFTPSTLLERAKETRVHLKPNGAWVSEASGPVTATDDHVH